MVAYSFQRTFAPDILSGRKRSTLRPKRKRAHAQPGDTLHLFTGMRTVNCVRLLTVPCAASRALDIHANGVRVDGQWRTNPAYFATLADIEGFSSFGNLQAWFDRQYGLPVYDLTQMTWDRAAARLAADLTALGVSNGG